MTPKAFTFNFDLQPAKKLRDAVNEKQSISIEKEHEIRDVKTNKNVPYYAWDRICAIMDRIDDTLEYLNFMELGHCRSSKSAFDFFEFLNCAYVVIEGIKIIGQIFAIDNAKIESIEKSQDAFGDALNAGGSDGQFFSYIRSLCAVHPFYTTKHPIYMKDSKLHCCPFVVWANRGIGSFHRDERDLSAHLYTSKQAEDIQSIPLYINQFETYINKWIAFIPDVIQAIYDYNDSVYDNYRSQPLKAIEDFENEIDYVFYLKQEYSKRFGDTLEYIFDKAASILEINLTNERNAEKLEKYKNAIRYSLKFVRVSLEEMKTDGFDYTGIKGENDTETFLLMELGSPDIRSEEFWKYHYNLSKVCYLECDHYSYYDRIWARSLIEGTKEFLSRYVVFTNSESDEELVLLVNLAIYLHALEQKCMLNRSIPNDLVYREKLLSADEEKELEAMDDTDESQEECIIQLPNIDWNTIKVYDDKTNQD